MPDVLSPISGNRQKITPVDAKYAPPPPPEISDGTQSYTVGQKLGRGGFAMCYQAQVKETKQLVALKVVKTQMAKKIEEKFRTELQIHSKMRHRYIAEFIRAFTLDERTFVVLELCGMGSFKEMIGNRKSLTPPEIRRFGVQILGALSYLHSRSIIHRDLKMANIFLDNNMEPKIGDFGLAAVLLTNDQYGVVRRTTLCGTPNYIAPEVLSKKNGHDTKADIWSFGVLIYTLMVGTTPFSRPGDQHNNDVFARVKEADYSWPESCRDRISEQAKDMVRTCLQDNSTRPNADEVAHHPFFSMSGGIPNSLSKDAFKALPACVTKRAPFEMRASYARISLEQLCEQSGLGDVRPLDYGRSVYHEFVAEEDAKRTPVIPLPSVYLPSEKPFAKPARRQGTIQRSKSRPNLSTQVPKVPEKTSRVATRSASVNTISHDTIRRPPPAQRQSESPIEPYFPYFSGGEALQAVHEDVREQQSRHLNGLADTITTFLQADEDTPLDWPTEPANLPPRVERWCNYSNKYGIGFTMSNGTIGCLFITEGHANRAVVVPGTVNHYLQRGSSKAAFPPNSQNPCFVERTRSGSLKALVEPASSYEFNAIGKIDLLPGVPDEVNERRKAIFNWSRFANYMTSRLAAESPEELPHPRQQTGPAISAAPAGAAADFPVAYQRLGTVNVWAHTSGALQFDFSQDHTKILLSPSGQHVEFWHPDPSDAAAAADRPSSADHSPPADRPADKPAYRGCVRCPTRVFFAGPPEENRALKHIAAAGRLRQKLGFACDALRMWAREGGVGCLGSERIYFDGRRTAVDTSDVPKRATWLTVKL